MKMVTIKKFIRETFPIYTCRFRGSVDRQAAFDFILTFSSQADLPPHYDLLVDFSEAAEITLHPNDFGLLSNFIDANVRHAGRSAYITGPKLSHVMFANVFAGIRRTSKPGQIEVFRSSTAAINWLL
jgi:hypothetical protein